MPLNREDVISRCKVLAAATVYDVLDKMGYPNQALSAEIQPLARGFRLAGPAFTDRKSTRLNSSHSQISYAVFCLKKNNLLPRPTHQPPRLLRHARPVPFAVPALP